MRLAIDVETLTVHVVLSRRNLIAQLHKLETPNSARRLESDSGAFDGWTLVFDAEPDQLHYGSRPQPPGEMHPDTEQRMNEWA